MFRIESKVDVASTEFAQNREVNGRLAAEYRERLAAVREMGPKDQRDRHVERNKLLVRQRLETLFDRNTPFLELNPLAAYDMYHGEAPAAGIVTGIGVVHGREVLVVANDATVKGGTYFPMTIKKHVRAQEIALQNRLPCIYLVDSGGIFLPLQEGTFPDRDHFGRIFFNQARLSSQNIPQIAAVMGSCTAGGAYQPAMSDEAVIVRKQGTIFIGGPPLVKAATGEVVTEEELGGADVHCRISGVADHYALNDKHALEICRNIVKNLQAPEPAPIGRDAPEDPYYDPEELSGIVPANVNKPYDIREVIARLVDGSRFHEFKELYGPTIVCGFARFLGYPAGIVANNGVLFAESSQKAAHFIELCTMRRIPIVFLQNITGFIVGKQYEHGGIARDGAKMVHAVACANVPKFTVIVGASNGAGNYAMCGRAFEPRLLWMWPNARISVMGGEQASNVLLTVKLRQLEKKGIAWTEEQKEEFRRPVLAEYERQGSPYYSTARLWDDGILLPAETREALALGIAMSLNAPVPETQYGVFRM